MIAPLLAAAASGSTALASAGPPFAIDWYTIDGGGALETTGGAFVLSGTIGQPDAGPAMTGGPFTLRGGFWAQAGGPSCSADWDSNGVVNAADVGAFLSDYFVDRTNGTLVTDFDNNGVVNAADVGAFLSAYFGQISDPDCNNG